MSTLVTTHDQSKPLLARIAVFSYGFVAYCMFFAAFLGAIAWVGNWILPKTIDTGTPGPGASAIVINVLLLSLFAIQHTIMARPAFKRWWTTIIPEAIERSTFVAITSLILGLIFWQWRPVAGTIWSVDQPALRAVLQGISLVGWLTVVYSTILIDHFDLFGMRQVTLYLLGRPYTRVHFQMRSLYKYVRHPLMLGFMIAFWFTPDMTGNHLLFAGVVTAYVLVALHIEERDLVAAHGADYVEYKRRVPMLLPIPKSNA